MKNKYVMKPADGKFAVEYGFEPRFRKWTFRVENFTLYIVIPSGASLAHKIADMMSKSFRKYGKFDSVRANINRMLEASASKNIKA